MDATVEFQWASVLVPALAALVGAAVGGFFTLIAASRSTKSAARQALKAQRAEWRRQDEVNRERLALQEAQHRRELLTRAVGILLDVLWAKERRLCDALHLARTSLTDSPVRSDDKALQLLGELDLETRADMLRALPYIHDFELKSRLESVQVIVNAAYNLRAAGPRHVTYEEYSRAMLETQWYFKWLRWNLECALLGEALPAGVMVPDLRRSLSEPAWPIPEGMPDHASLPKLTGTPRRSFPLSDQGSAGTGPGCPLDDQDVWASFLELQVAVGDSRNDSIDLTCTGVLLRKSLR